MMIVLSMILGFLASVALLCYWYQTYISYTRLLNKFSGPRMYPVFGNILGYSNKPDILFKQIREITQHYTETWRGWSMFFGIGIQIVTADDAKIILSNNQDIKKGIFYDLFKPWLGTGLLTSSGEKWQQRRKILTPTFHFNILRNFIEIFEEHSKRLVEQIKKECNDGNTNIVPFITESALASICETAMGLKIELKDEAQCIYFKLLHQVASHIIYRALSPWLCPEFLYRLSSHYYKFKNILNYLHGFTSNVIKTREKIFKESDMENLDKSPIDDGIGLTKRRLAVLDLLISLRRESGVIDSAGIREEVDTFIFEGHDTVAVSICYTLLLLANHKDIQEKVINEVDEIFGKSTRNANFNDLNNMNYLGQCIKESLRLYPSVPFIVRHIQKEYKLTHHVVPANTIAFFHIYNIHRDPKVYPEPEKFDPDRFSPENSKGRCNYAYLPFSVGARNCIGQKYAMLELKSIISNILRNFRLEPIHSVSNLTFIVDLVLRSKDPILIKFIPRNNNSKFKLKK